MISIVRSYGSFPEAEFGVQLGSNWTYPDSNSLWTDIPGWVPRTPDVVDLEIIDGGFVVPADGEAYLAARLAFGSNYALTRNIRLLHNGAVVVSADGSNAPTLNISSSTKRALSAGDTVQLQAQGASTASTRVISGGSGTWLVATP